MALGLNFNGSVVRSLLGRTACAESDRKILGLQFGQAGTYAAQLFHAIRSLGRKEFDAEVVLIHLTSH
jgi:hypothetical protein